MYVVVASDTGTNRSVTGADRFNLHADPQGIERIAVAREHAPLRSFLANVNASGSIFATIACKIWSATEAGGAESKIFASYIDVIFLQESTNFGCGPHEELARRLAQLLEREPGEALRAELRISPVVFAADEDGFCLRIILYAHGRNTGTGAGALGPGPGARATGAAIRGSGAAAGARCSRCRTGNTLRRSGAK